MSDSAPAVRWLFQTPHGGHENHSVGATITLSGKDTTMRVMVIIKATKNSEAGVRPKTEMLAAMGEFNEALVRAGIMVSGDGLHPSSRGKRVRFSAGQKLVSEGPFPLAPGLIAGFWIWNVKSMDEALDWVRRCPDPMPDEEAEIEIRPLFEAEDFGENLTPELRAQEDRLRRELEQQQKA
jgi:hypothetical protein